HICYSPIMLRRNTRPTLLPYTTLFRSSLEGTGQEEDLNLFLHFFLTETGFRIHSNSVQHPINFMPVNFLTIDIIPVFRIVKFPSYHYFTISGIKEFNFTIVIEFIIQGGEIGLILQFFLELFLNFLVVCFHIPQGLVTIPSNGVNILIGFAILNMNQNRKPF